jgi:hypothetical protein
MQGRRSAGEALYEGFGETAASQSRSCGSGRVTVILWR